MDLTISINTLIYRGYDLPIVLGEISRLGVRLVELAFIKAYLPDLSGDFFSEKNGQNLRGMLKEHGLSSLALSAHMDLGKEGSISSFKKRMAFAKEVGANIIISNASQRSNEAIFFKNMETLAQYAQSLNLVIGLENPGDGEDHIIGDAESGALAVRKIGSDFVKLNYDIGNVFINTRGRLYREEGFEELLPWMAHLHLKDAREEGNQYLYCEIGKGVVNYRSIFQSLLKKATTIPMAIELPLCLKRGRDFVPWVDSARAELSEIREVLKGSLQFIKDVLRQRPNP